MDYVVAGRRLAPPAPIVQFLWSMQFNRPDDYIFIAVLHVMCVLTTFISSNCLLYLWISPRCFGTYLSTTVLLSQTVVAYTVLLQSGQNGRAFCIWISWQNTILVHNAVLYALLQAALYYFATYCICSIVHMCLNYANVLTYSVNWKCSVSVFSLVLYPVSAPCTYILHSWVILQCIMLLKFAAGRSHTA